MGDSYLLLCVGGLEDSVLRLVSRDFASSSPPVIVQEVRALTDPAAVGRGHAGCGKLLLRSKDPNCAAAVMSLPYVNAVLAFVSHSNGIIEGTQRLTSSPEPPFSPPQGPINHHHQPNPSLTNTSTSKGMQAIREAIHRADDCGAEAAATPQEGEGGGGGWQAALETWRHVRSSWGAGVQQVGDKNKTWDSDACGSNFQPTVDTKADPKVFVVTPPPLETTSLETASQLTSLAFRASCIRDGNGHGFKSTDVCGELGLILGGPDGVFPEWTVDLKHFDLEAVALVSGDEVTLALTLDPRQTFSRSRTPIERIRFTPRAASSPVMGGGCSSSGGGSGTDISHCAGEDGKGGGEGDSEEVKRGVGLRASTAILLCELAQQQQQQQQQQRQRQQQQQQQQRSSSSPLHANTATTVLVDPMGGTGTIPMAWGHSKSPPKLTSSFTPSSSSLPPWGVGIGGDLEETSVQTFRRAIDSHTKTTNNDIPTIAPAVAADASAAATGHATLAPAAASISTAAPTKASDATTVESVLTSPRNPCEAVIWDASRLPLRPGCVDTVVSDLPFAVRVNPGKNRFVERLLIPKVMCEISRVLVHGGCAVLLTNHPEAVVKGANKNNLSFRPAVESGTGMGEDSSSSTSISCSKNSVEGEGGLKKKLPAAVKPRAKNPQSKVLGVKFSARDGKWRAMVTQQDTKQDAKQGAVPVFLGCFELEQDAIEAVENFHAENNKRSSTAGSGSSSTTDRSVTKNFLQEGRNESVAAEAAMATETMAAVTMTTITKVAAVAPIVVEEATTMVMAENATAVVGAAAASEAVPEAVVVDKLFALSLIDCQLLSVELGLACDASPSRRLSARQAGQVLRAHVVVRSSSRRQSGAFDGGGDGGVAAIAADTAANGVDTELESVSSMSPPQETSTLAAKTQLRGLFAQGKFPGLVWVAVSAEDEVRDEISSSTGGSKSHELKPSLSSASPKTATLSPAEKKKQEKQRKREGLKEYVQRASTDITTSTPTATTGLPTAAMTTRSTIRSVTASTVSRPTGRINNKGDDFHHGLVVVSNNTANIGGLLCAVVILKKE